MWIFGQVWFACLVGFAVGVLLDWAVRVRPLNKRVAELEQRLATDARSAGPDGADFDRAGFDRGPFSPVNTDSNGFVTQRNRGGLLTPSPDAPRRDLGTELISMESAAPPVDDQRTEVRNGVEDFPGVSRISSWEAEAEEATRNAPEPWHPAQPATHIDEPDDARTEVRSTSMADPETPPEWQPILSSEQDESGEPWAPLQPPPDVEPWRSQLQPPPEPLPPTDANADQQYLEFLRAGAAHAPAEPGEDEDEVDFRGEVPDDAPGAAEVTTVLPFPLSEQTTEFEENAFAEQGYSENGYSSSDDSQDDSPHIEGYEAYENYADEYQRNGFERNGHAQPEPEPAEEHQYPVVQHFGDYQPEDIEEPEESTPLPRRGARSESMRFAPFQPFHLPFEPAEAERRGPAGDEQRLGHMTPIEDGGFQPFAKPENVAEGDGYDTGHDGAWLTSEGLVGGGMAAAAGQSGSGAHALAGGGGGENDDANASSWFDQQAASELPQVEITMTQRMLPVSRPDLDHPDLLGKSVFGGADDPVYEDEPEAPRSLFEPIVPADTLEDDFQAPAYEGSSSSDYAESSDYASSDYTAPDYTASEYTEYSDSAEYAEPAQQDIEPEGAAEITNEMDANEIMAPRPVRVRTGVDGPATQSIPAFQPVPQPSESSSGEHDPAGGPFGPGSALPAADGSAPDPGFTIKARTSSMVFHTESSPFYDRLEPQVWFRSQEDAQRAGFTSWERPRSW